MTQMNDTDWTQLVIAFSPNRASFIVHRVIVSSYSSCSPASSFASGTRRTSSIPHYVEPATRRCSRWRSSCSSPIAVRPGRTRGEIADDLSDLIPEGPQRGASSGLAKLLEDRCEFEVAADHPPDELREAVFQ